MKVYRSGEFDDGRASERPRPGAGRRRFGFGRAVLILLLVFAAVLIFLAWPFGGQRVVLLGSDARADEVSRSDTIAVMKAGSGMLAVPRDTLVEIPDIGEDKINAAYANGGPPLTVATVEGLTGEAMGGYVVIDFGGVEEIVDALGGITIEVQEPIELGTESGETISLQPGTRELDGAQALAFVRYRGGPTADIGRIARQQQFLQALASQVVSPAKLPRLPATALAVWRNVETDMNPVSAAFFAARAGLGGFGEVEIYPGTPQYIDGISYWVPDEEAGAEVVSRTIE